MHHHQMLKSFDNLSGGKKKKAEQYFQSNHDGKAAEDGKLRMATGQTVSLSDHERIAGNHGAAARAAPTQVSALHHWCKSSASSLPVGP